MKVKSKIIASIIICVMTMPAMASSIDELELSMKMVLMEKKVFDVSDKNTELQSISEFKHTFHLNSIEDQAVNFKYKQDIAYDNSKAMVLFSK